MRTKLLLSAALGAGLIIGVTTTLLAQSSAPAYLVAELDIHDGETFARDYAPKVASTLQPFGGQFLTSGKLTALEGNPPQRFVIIAFDNVDTARS